jgi:hypothetical protein
MPPMHYSVHGDGQIFLQKSGRQIAIAWDVKYLSSTGLLSVISVTRDDPKNDAWRSKNAEKTWTQQDMNSGWPAQLSFETFTLS